MEMKVRPRRLRTTEAMRKMVRETRLDKSTLIYPIFAIDGTGIKEEIPSMPGQYRYSVDQLPYALEEAANLGVNNILMFGIPEHKDECGSQAYAHDGIVQRALREGKKEFPDMLYIADVCMCEYTSHGHCGILDGEYVDNDKTLKMLAQIASSQAEAGADIVAPSDMMDGHVAAIREKLDEDGFINTPIMSYAVKFASAFYGPFRDAADSAPHFGDRKSYQMDYHNGREAMKEALLDVEEGTDFLIVKPAMAFYDLLERVVSATNIPIATYSVSGEYSMVKAAAQNGWIDEERIIGEMAVGAYRAGAGMYITYFAKELAKMIDEGKIG
ncbi:MAG: porphobilinogen synthase [Firmicutes bacterium]|nr:porphobilinogen synthase [Bacillota bacterium]